MWTECSCHPAIQPQLVEHLVAGLEDGEPRSRFSGSGPTRCRSIAQNTLKILGIMMYVYNLLPTSVADLLFCSARSRFHEMERRSSPPLARCSPTTGRRVSLLDLTKWGRLPRVLLHRSLDPRVVGHATCEMPLELAHGRLRLHKTCSDAGTPIRDSKTHHNRVPRSERASL
jgi:hypothetical protein